MKTILSVFSIFAFAATLNGQELKSFLEKKEWGYKDNTGKIVVKAKYEYAWDFAEGMGRVKNKKDKYGFVDITGKEVISPEFEDANNFKEGLAAVKMQGKYGYVDKTGKQVIPCVFAKAYDFSEGLAVVQVNGKYGFIDKTGKEVIPAKYSDAEGFSEGLAAIELNDRYGFIDRTGREVIPIEYADADNFREGLAAVKRYGKYGYIDKTNTMIIEPRFDYAGNFSEGEARVKIGDKSMYIDKTGKNEEIRKQEAREKEEEEERKRAVAKALEKRDAMATEVYQVYLQYDQTVFSKVNAVNEYLKGSVKQNAKGEFNPSLIMASSGHIKDVLCKNARQEVLNYKNAVKKISLEYGKNELYDLVSSELKNIENYLSSCEVWAEAAKDKTFALEPDAVLKQLSVIEKPLVAMAKDERAIRALIGIYKKRNGL